MSSQYFSAVDFWDKTKTGFYVFHLGVNPPQILKFLTIFG
jgi:hypothetical protein